MKNLFDAVSAIMGFIIFGGMFFGIVKSCVGGSNYSSSSASKPSYYQSTYHKYKRNSTNIYLKKSNTFDNSLYEQQQRILRDRYVLQQQDLQNQNIYKRRTDSARSNYAILWNECEELEALLEENDIDHESLEYPIDYYELKDLRDGYQYLLDENEIDY